MAVYEPIKMFLNHRTLASLWILAHRYKLNELFELCTIYNIRTISFNSTSYSTLGFLQIFVVFVTNDNLTKLCFMKLIIVLANDLTLGLGNCLISAEPQKSRESSWKRVG
jgi:hypothetical protein